MPILEKDALEVLRLIEDPFNEINEDQRKAGANFLRQYREQQAALKQPEFPTAERERERGVMKMRAMFQDREGHGFTREERENFFGAMKGLDGEARYRALNRAFVAHSLGTTPDKLNGSYDGYRDAYAKQTWGLEGVKESEFFAKIADDFDREDETLGKATQAAVSDAMAGRKDWMKAYAAAGFDEAAFPDKFQAWEWRERFRAAYEATEAETAPFAQDAKAFVDALQRSMTGEAAEGEDATIAAFRDRLIDAPYDERRAMLRAITVYGSKLGGEADKGGVGGWFQQAGESAARIIKGMGSDTQLAEAKLDELRGKMLVPAKTGPIDSEAAAFAVVEGELRFAVESERTATEASYFGREPREMREPTPEERQFLEAGFERQQRAIGIAREVKAIAESTDPLKSITASTFGSSVAIMAPLMVSPYYAFVIAQGYANLEYDHLRLKEPNMSATDARIISLASGATQGALDLAGAKALKTLPSVRFLLEGKVTRELAKRALLRTGKVYVFENIIEGLQDATAPILQGLWGALQKDVPNVDWEAEKEHWINTRSDVAIGMLPLTLLGTGVATVRDVAGARGMLQSYEGLRASGLADAVAADIVEKASTGDLKGAQETLKAEWPKRSKASQEAFDAIARDQQARMDAFTRLEQAGKLPAMRRTSDGWALVDSEGTLTEFGSHAEADQARWDYATSQFLAVPEEVRATIRQLESELEAGREIAFEFSPERMDAARAESEGLASGQAIAERMEAGEALASNATPEAEYAEAVDSVTAASVDAETAAASAQILGMNQSQWVDGIQRTTIKLWQGASPLTIVEEKLESDVARMLKDGRAPWLVSALREYEKVSGDKLFRDVESDDMLTGQDIREAYSHLGTSYFVGKSRREGGAALANRGFRKIAADLMRTRLGGFITAYGHFFRSIFKRAAKLRKLSRDGKLNPELERELARSLGISEQFQEQEAQLVEAERLALEMQDTLQYNPSEDAPFSALPAAAMDASAAKAFQDEEASFSLVNATGYTGDAADLAAYNEFLRRDMSLSEKVTNEYGVPKTNNILFRPDRLYRVIDDNGFDDLKKNSVVRPNPNGRYEHLFAAIGAIGARYKGDYIVEIIPDERWGYVSGGYARTTEFVSTSDQIRVFKKSGDGYDVAIDNIGDAPFSMLTERTALVEKGDGYQKVALPDGATLEGPASFSIIPDYGIEHRPNDEGPRSFDLAEDGLMPSDVYDHPEWYSAMEPKIIKETMAQLRRIKGKPDADVTIYRAGPVGEMNPGDWVSLSQEYARTHADAQDPEGFKVWKAKAKAKDVRWAMDDLAEFGYFGEALVAEDSGVSFSILAYHGTPHKVDKFSLDKIGTGEGAQAYGWGLYFAEARKVAEIYSKIAPSGGENSPEIIQLAKDWLAQRNIDTAPYIDTGWTEESLPDLAWEFGWQRPDGNLYTVELDAAQEDFLDWDKPLSEQSEKVRQALGKFDRDYLPDSDDYDSNETGQMVYMRAWENAIRKGVAKPAKVKQKELSERLRKKGIRGIRYLDGNSRDGGSGTYNYVIFDESLVKIIAENGAPVESEAGFSAIPRNVAADPQDFEARLVKMFDPFQRSPELRVQIMQDVQRRVSESLRKWQPIAALAGRTKSDVERERKDRYENAVSDGIEALPPATIEALGLQETDINAKESPVLEALLTRKSYTRKDGKTVYYWGGRLESAAAFKERTGAKRTPDEYDGAGDLPSWIWGGTLRPDEARDEMGLETTNELWETLHSAIDSANMRKAEYQAARKEIARIEREAKAEADEWASRELARLDQTGLERENVTGALRTLNAMLAALPPEVRGRVGGFVTISRKAGPAAMLKELMARAEKADAELEAWLRKDINRQVKDLLDRAKPAKDEAGKKRKGKAGADIHALFDAVRTAFRLNADETETMAAGFDALADDPDATPEVEAHNRLVAGMVRLFGDWKNADAARRFSALENAKSIWARGYNEWQAKLAKEREQRQAARDALIVDAGAAGKASDRDRKLIAENGFGGWMKKVALNLLPFEGVARYVFGDNSAEAIRLADMERTAASQYDDEIFAETNAIEDLFTRIAGGELEGQRLRWRLAQKDVAVGDRILSQMEMIQALLMWRQEDGKRHMIGQLDESGKPSGPWHYGEPFIQEVESKLSGDAREVMAFISDGYAREYDTINPIFRDLNGIDLPRVKDYAPITVAPIQAAGALATDPVSGMPTSGRSTTPGALLTRGRAIAEPEFRDALQTYVAHKKQMGHWKAYAYFNRDARAILGNREVSNAVTGKGSDEAKKVLGLWLDDFAQGGNREAQAHLALAQGINAIQNRNAAIALVGRISTLLLQSTQLSAAMAEMPMGAYMSRFAKLMTGRLEYRQALESDYIQRRIQQMPPIVQQAMEGLKSGRPNAVKFAAQKLSRTIPGMDGLATAGTFAIVRDYQLTQALNMGLPMDEAIRVADTAAQRVTDRIAQPTRRGARSIFENTSSGSWRLVWAFSSEARKNLGLIAGAAMRKSGTDLGRSLLYVVLAQGIMSQIIRNFWRDVRDDEDDEVFDAKHWDLRRIVLGVALDPLYGVPVFGSSAEAAVYAATGERIPSDNLLSTIPRAVTAFGRIDDYARGDGELDEAMRDLEVILSGMGLFSDTIAGLASFSHLLRDAVAIGDNAIGTD